MSVLASTTLGWYLSERDGYLDDPRYIETLPEDHPIRGASIEEVSEDLDHESVATTRGYDHETVERKKKAALEIENELHFPAPPITDQYANVHFAGEQVTLGSVRDQHASFTI